MRPGCIADLSEARKNNNNGPVPQAAPYALA